MSKVLMIGIDALDPHLLSKFKQELPNFRRLMENSPDIKLKSIFPPDTIPAWVTIYTGLNPAKHGIIYAADVFGSSWKNIKNIDISIFRGKTFWDYASNARKKVCVLFPQLTYSPWPVNGIMIGKSIDHNYGAYPSSICVEYKIDRLSRFTGEHPGPKNLGRFLKEAKEVTLDEADIGLKVSNDYNWDLFFIYFGWLDIVKHYFWRYHDEFDPTYPGITSYKDAIKDFYRLYDRIIGDFISSHPDAIIIILSDHGHGMRPPKTVNINEFLRKNELLFSKASKSNPLPYLAENLKRILLDFVHTYELDYWLIKLATRTPVLSSKSKNIYTSKSNINTENTLACLSTFIGPKSYSHGGIEIKRENLEKMGWDYEDLREYLIKELLELKHPEIGEKLLIWACRRENIYQGSYLTKYPDILFELREGYGVYWGIHCPLIGTAYEHNLASGGHKKDAVFLSSNLKSGVAREEMTLMDIAPTILDLLEIRGDFNFDGQSIFNRNG